MSKPNVLVIGVGGIGSIVAYALDTNGKADVSIVVRGDYQKIVDQGYEFHSFDYGEISGWRPGHVYPSVDKAAVKGGYDFVVIATKNLPDVVKLEDVVEPVISEGKTTIVLVQNGFDIGRPFIAKYPENVCLSGVSHNGSHINHGVVTQTQNDKCIISYFENPHLSVELQKSKAEAFIAIYSNTANTVSYHPSAKYQRYQKLVYNAAMNTSCSLAGTDVGRLELAGALDTVALPAMHEVIAVAKADGVEIGKGEINRLIHSDDGDWFEPSMWVDVQQGNPIEIEVILGNLLRVARELNVETPTLNVLYHLLAAVQFRLKEGRGLFKLSEKRPISDKYYG